MQKAIQAEAKKSVQTEKEAIVRQYMKLTCIALNERLGFGQKRLEVLMAEIIRMSDISETDEEFWTHVDRRIRQLGLEFLEEDAGCST
nr:MAG TPA: hypothetical protein [Caudoviricetes sp.]